MTYDIQDAENYDGYVEVRSDNTYDILMHILEENTDWRWAGGTHPTNLTMPYINEVGGLFIHIAQRAWIGGCVLPGGAISALTFLERYGLEAYLSEADYETLEEEHLLIDLDEIDGRPAGDNLNYKNVDVLITSSREWFGVMCVLHDRGDWSFKDGRHPTDEEAPRGCGLTKYLQLRAGTYTNQQHIGTSSINYYEFISEYSNQQKSFIPIS